MEPNKMTYTRVLIDGRHKRRVPQDEIDMMLDMRKMGMTYKAIGIHFGRSTIAIYCTINNKRRAKYGRTYNAKKRAKNDTERETRAD